MDQPLLQPEPRNRGAEQQRRIGEVAKLARGIVRIEHCGGEVDGDRQAQEKLADQEVPVGVGSEAPQRSEQEGCCKTQQVERPPALFPGDPHDARVEHGHVSEQPGRGFGPSAQQDRHGIAAQKARHRQSQRVLHHRQRRAQRRKHDHEAEGRAGRNHLVNPCAGKDRQVQHRHPGTLHLQAEIRAGDPLGKAEGEQGRPCGRDGREPRFDREQAGLNHQPGEEDQPDEQHYKARADNHVAAHQPFARAVERSIIQPVAIGVCAVTTAACAAASAANGVVRSRSGHGRAALGRDGVGPSLRHDAGCGQRCWLSGKDRRRWSYRSGGFRRRSLRGRHLHSWVWLNRCRVSLCHRSSPGWRLPIRPTIRPQFDRPVKFGAQQVLQPGPHQGPDEPAQYKPGHAQIAAQPNQCACYDCPENHCPTPRPSCPVF